jgi:nitrite reductase/ring-hydroxylating ferredoxin subunit
MKTHMNRRDLLRRASLVLGGGCLCHVARGATAKSTCCSTPDLEPASLSYGDTTLTVDLAQAPSLAEVGDAAFLVNAERQLELILVRAAPDRFVALSRNCTHGGQVVSYARKRGAIICNNYNHSVFDLDGQVVKGPAGTPLKSYPVTLKDGRLEIAVGGASAI